MDELKRAVEERKRAVAAAAAASAGAGAGEKKKYVRRADLEAARLKRLREEEEAELAAKAAARRAREGDAGPGPASTGAAASTGKHAATPAQPAASEALPPAEVVRRLRLLDQPATLFGEDDASRSARLAAALEAYAVADEAAGGGQQENLLLALEKAERAKKAAAAAAAAAKAGEKKKEAAPTAPPPVVPPPVDPTADRGASPPPEPVDNDRPADPTAAAFADAAARLAAARAEAALAPEDRLARRLRGWVSEWEADLEAADRAAAAGPPNAADARSRHQATLQFKQTVEYLKPLFRKLKKRALDAELLAGIDLMTGAMAGRNYLAAADFYTRMAIGNAAWPIGVTSVGIHERKGREKISHVGSGAGGSAQGAHIMNDEATRKFLQALKRLLTFVQRAHPADPSRCVEFGGVGGADKAALLAAEAAGRGPGVLALPAPPSFMDEKNPSEVAVPARWDAILKQSTVYKEKEEQAAAKRAKK